MDDDLRGPVDQQTQRKQKSIISSHPGTGSSPMASPTCRPLAYPCRITALCSSLALLHSAGTKGFRFEAFWLKFSEFHEQVLKSWTMPVSAGNKARALHIKLARLAKDLKRWNRNRIAALKQESADAQQRVLRIDQLQDQRPLTDAEIQERK
jgi:hypothetical protein